GNPLPLGGVPRARLDQLLVAHPGGASGLGEARVVSGIRKDPGKRIDLDDVRDAGRVDANVDARPVATAERAIGGEYSGFDRAAERIVDERGALEDLERVVGAVPEPLRLVAVHRERAL